nr:GDSL-type esterase/lipase family protein [Paenibacillus sp. ACRRX]
MPVANELKLGDIIQELQQSRGNETPFISSTLVNDRIVCFGDSITSGDAAGVRMYPTWLSFHTGGFVRNSGVSGNTVAQMLQRIDADVIAHRPGICVILGGTNDINSARPLADITADITAITNKLISNNITPIWCTIPPRSDNLAHLPTIRKLNTWIYAHCLRQGLEIIDLYTAFSKPDGTPKDGFLLPDKLHPTTAGMTEIAKLVASYLPRNQRKIPTLFGGDAESIVPNPTFSGSNSVANGWMQYGSAGTLLSYRREVSPNDSSSMWQVIRKEQGIDSKTGGIRCVLPATLVAGRTYRVELDIDYESDVDNVVTSYFQFKDSSNAVIGSAVFLLRSPTLKRLDNVRISAEITTPAGTVSTEWITYSQATSAFTLKVGRPRIIEYYSTP